MRGRWVEVNAERLSRALAQLGEIERRAFEHGIGFQEAMRMIAGADTTFDGNSDSETDWAQFVGGPWLSETLKGLRSQEGLARVDPGSALKGTLRPYQQIGLHWLYLLARLGLGGCLADDMGLGKTIQVLALLLTLRQQSDATRLPSLLVVPASLLANWAAELERFTPSLNAIVAHPSEMSVVDLKCVTPDQLRTVDLVITNPIRIHCSGEGFFQLIVGELVLKGDQWVRCDHATPLKIASTVISHSSSNHSGT